MTNSEAISRLERTAREMECWALSRLAANFNLSPGNTVLDAGSEGLCACLLRSEAGCKALHCGAALAPAVCNFLLSEHAGEETIAKAFDGCSNTVDLDHVDAGSDKHVCNLNDFAGMGNRIRKQ